jgi:hypothetical protein
MRGVVHVACMEIMHKKMFVGEPEGKIPAGRLCLDGKTILKCI